MKIKFVRFPYSGTIHDGILIADGFYEKRALITSGNLIGLVTPISNECEVTDREVEVKNDLYLIDSTLYRKIMPHIYKSITNDNFIYKRRAQLFYKTNTLKQISRYVLNDYILETTTKSFYKVVSKDDIVLLEDCYSKEITPPKWSAVYFTVDKPSYKETTQFYAISLVPSAEVLIRAGYDDNKYLELANTHILTKNKDFTYCLYKDLLLPKMLLKHNYIAYDYIKEAPYYIINNEKIYIKETDEICPKCGDILKNNHICKLYCDECSAQLKTDAEIKHKKCTKCQTRYVNCYNGHWAKKTPVFEKPDERKTKMHFGIELEIDCYDGDQDAALDEIYAFNSKNIFNPLCYTESDGSLSSDGIEMVWNPKTLSWFKRKKNIADIKQLFSKLLSHGYTSHNIKTCGLHIHIDRKTLGDNNRYTAGKIVYFVNKLFDDYFLPLCRRGKSYDALDFCKKIDVDDDDDEDTLHDKAREDRYVLINCSNKETIEFRLWRGTLNIDSFLASIYLTNSIIKFCRKKSLNSLQRATFKDFYKTLSAFEKEYCRVKLNKSEEEICA